MQELITDDLRLFRAFYIGYIYMKYRPVFINRLRKERFSVFLT